MLTKRRMTADACGELGAAFPSGLSCAGPTALRRRALDDATGSASEAGAETPASGSLAVGSQRARVHEAGESVAVHEPEPDQGSRNPHKSGIRPQPQSSVQASPFGATARLPELVGDRAQLGARGAVRSRTLYADPTIRAALDVPRLTLSRIARELGVTRETVESWRKGRRRPRPKSRMRLAELLLAHARNVNTVAAELQREARRLGARSGGFPE
jgi:hypothetical protein